MKFGDKSIRKFIEMFGVFKDTLVDTDTFDGLIELIAKVKLGLVMG